MGACEISREVLREEIESQLRIFESKRHAELARRSRERWTRVFWVVTLGCPVFVWGVVLGTAIG